MTDISGYEDFDDQEAQAAEQLKASELIKRADQDLDNVMSTESGRRFIWNLLAEAGVFKSSFTGDNNATNFKEGQRNAGLRVFSRVMDICPDKYLVMAKEAKEESDNG